jgi:hypothetical protein
VSAASAPSTAPGVRVALASLLLAGLVGSGLSDRPGFAESPATEAATTPEPTPTRPLREQIDRLIEAKLEEELPGQGPAAPSTDAEFVRRIWLDLTGMIPPADEARAFLDDPSPYKRARLIDRLLESPDYARRMEQVFDVVWMERRPDLHVPAADWRAFLRKAFAENRPYDVLVQQILGADGSDPAVRPAAKFALDREADPNVLTKDIGRLFLGMDITCCQCHDHPLIDGYKQSYYYGLFAFWNRSVLIADPKGAVLGEKAEGDVSFSSVFKKKVTHQTGPRILDEEPLEEPAVSSWLTYYVPPDRDGKVRPVPFYSRRARLAESLASAEVQPFARNIVNRLWALVMGRGIVHPVDLHHDDNPPSHPELLDLLAERFVAMKFDIKALLREMVSTRAYQRSSEPPPDASGDLADPARFAVAPLRPMSPEQLAWSLMQGTGLRDAVRNSVTRKLDGDPRMRAILDLDPPRRALRSSMIENDVETQLARNVAPFVRQFGGVAGQSQTAAESTSTVDQALFLTNGGLIRSWLQPSADRLVGRLSAQSNPEALAEELYLALLSRRPTPDEKAEVADYLAKRTADLPKDKDPAKERVAAIQELAWAVIASTEFRFNH